MLSSIKAKIRIYYSSAQARVKSQPTCQVPKMAVYRLIKPESTPSAFRSERRPTRDCFLFKYVFSTVTSRSSYYPWAPGASVLCYYEKYFLDFPGAANSDPKHSQGFTVLFTIFEIIISDSSATKIFHES